MYCLLYHTIADAILICDDLDSNGSPAITLDVGLLTGTVGDATNSRTCGAEIFSASTAAQTGAVARPTLKTALISCQLVLTVLLV